MNASIAWDEGRYVDAMRDFTALLGSDSASFRERIALLTGENWKTTLVAENARAPRWSGNGRFIAMDLGTGQNRVTRIVRANDGSLVSEVKGTMLVFSPDGTKAAYVDGVTNDGALMELDLATGTSRTLQVLDCARRRLRMRRMARVSM